MLEGIFSMDGFLLSPTMDEKRCAVMDLLPSCRSVTIFADVWVPVYVPIATINVKRLSMKTTKLISVQ